MKKTIVLTIVILATGLIFFFLRAGVPFMGIAGTSMKPELSPGDLILIEQISPRDVKEGDIIIFEIPHLVRERYNYPAVVAHRVSEIHQRSEEIIFETKGDDTGQDPFVVRTMDLKGVVSKKIPYLGLPLLFLQSKQGLISIAIIFFLVSLGIYGQEIRQLKQSAQKEIFSPVLAEQQEIKEILAEYGKHLKSHTEVMKNLGEATRELKEVLERLNQKLN